MTKLSVPEYLYRFRPLERLLEKGEFANQEIYFAPPEQLNDPMEGFLDVVWRGDDVLWRNLLRNYLISLEYTVTLASLTEQGSKFGAENVLVFLNPDNLPTPRAKQKSQDIATNFFELEPVKQLLRYLSGLSRAVRRIELELWLTLLHPAALEIIVESNAKLRLLDPATETHGAAARKAAEIMNSELFEQLSAFESAEHGEAALRLATESLNGVNRDFGLLAAFNAPELANDPRKALLFLEYPARYLTRLERLVYPPWYAACFMASCENPAVWGHYGSAHTGVCLKFRAARNDSRSTGLLLENCITSYGAQGPKRGERFFRFERVSYGSNHPEVDFFRSLGRLQGNVIRKFWSTDEQGRASTVFDPEEMNERWRRTHWDLFGKSTGVKSEEWSYEQEYRLVLTSILSDLLEPKDRTLRFKFSDLEAVIFGLRTPLSAKVRIMKMVDEKCEKDGRNDFKFLQAEYHSDVRKMRFREMAITRRSA